MLYKLACRSTLFAAAIGTVYHGVHSLFIREPFGPLSIPWGIFCAISLGGFWVALFCVTPNKWWGKI